LRGFPGDDGTVQPGEVLCNPAPGEINIDARMVAGSAVTSILYHFYNGKLYEIALVFPAVRYGVTKSAFLDKYGPPSRQTTSEFQNGFGARWTGEDLFWLQGTQTVSLEEGGNNGPGQDHFASIGSSAVIMDTALMPRSSSTKTQDF